MFIYRKHFAFLVVLSPRFLLVKPKIIQDKFNVRRTDSLRHIRSPWTASYTQSGGRCLVLRPLALGTAPTSLAFDDELITLSFCRVNDVATLRLGVYTNEHTVP